VSATNVERTAIAFRIGLAAAAMARGLTDTEAERAFEILSTMDAPKTVGEAYRQIEEAMNVVRQERLDERWPDR
jgi:hypothetical protein